MSADAENMESVVLLKTTEGILRGDHLVVKHGQHEHHVLVIEDIKVPGKTSIKVIEYKHDFFTKKVVKRQISVDLKKDLLYRINSHFHMSSKDIERAIMKAETQIGYKKYAHTSEYNCEHFVKWSFANTIYREKIITMRDIKRGDHIIDSGILDWHMIAVEDGSQYKPLQVTHSVFLR
ncbi:uncharacterized protein [Ptychodera flava]|uniref:uncharacterized protein n=1 Tax=Ptychodera flava TaxID=63121 RepID=UPI003969F4E5